MELEEDNELYATSYSLEQGHFHVETLNEYFKTTQAMILDNKSPSYFLIGISTGALAAHELCERFREVMVCGKV